jgi:hypothetical protein
VRRGIGIAAALMVGACGDSTGVSPDALAGTWEASVLEFTNQASVGQIVEAVNLGARMTLTFRADGTYTSVVELPGVAVETTNGTFVVNGSLLRFDPGSDGELEAIVARNEDRLTLQTDDSAFDFDGDGTTERAALRAAFERG